MSEIISFNGLNYTIPDVDDENWGQNVTSYLVAVASGTLQKVGGSFILTADANLGTNFGLVSKYYKSITSNIASAGSIRLAKTDLIDWRNNANTGNLVLGIDGSDNLTFNGVALSSGIPNPVDVAHGGTGDTTLSAYAILAGGTTSTNPVQSISGLGTTGQVLTSNGAATLPTWQTISVTAGVSSITGTANQIIASASTGAVTLSAPQDIATSSSPTFTGITLTGTATFNKAPVLPTTTYTASSGSPVTPDARNITVLVITVDANLTLNGPSNPYSGQKLLFQLHNDASHVVTLATGSGNFRFGTDITSYTATASKTDYIGAVWNNADSRWDVVSLIQGF